MAFGQTPKEFFLKWNGIGLDFDGVYDFQCVDVFKQFNQDVVGAPNVNGNAVDYWTNYPNDFYDKIPNSLTAYPQEGDVVIWGTGLGQFGHIAICYAADVNHFVSFDQNYPIGSLCHFQSHNYDNVLGWLRPKNLPGTAPPAPVINDQTVLPITDASGNLMEVQAVRSLINDQRNTVMNLQNNVTQLNAKIDAMQLQIDQLSQTPAPQPPDATGAPTVTFKSGLAKLLYRMAQALG